MMMNGLQNHLFPHGYKVLWAHNYGIGSIEIETINSKGVVRSYGPWGQVSNKMTTPFKVLFMGFMVAHPPIYITLVSTSNSAW